jgi:hypothetical protein
VHVGEHADTLQIEPQHEAPRFAESMALPLLVSPAPFTGRTCCAHTIDLALHVRFVELGLGLLPSASYFRSPDCPSGSLLLLTRILGSITTPCISNRSRSSPPLLSVLAYWSAYGCVNGLSVLRCLSNVVETLFTQSPRVLGRPG